GPWLWSGLALLSYLALGCGAAKHEGHAISSDEKHILQVVRLWGAYKQELHKAPSNAEELKAWAKSQKPEVLGKLNIEDVDKAFVSPRDSQPYEVIKPPTSNPMGMGTVVLEKTGVKGMHL